MAVNAQITLCKYHCNIDFVKLYKKLVNLITWFEKRRISFHIKRRPVFLALSAIWPIGDRRDKEVVIFSKKLLMF